MWNFQHPVPWWCVVFCHPCPTPPHRSPQYRPRRYFQLASIWQHPDKEFSNRGYQLEKLLSGAPIPQRLYCQGNPIPHGAAGQRIMFGMEDRRYLPAELALSGQCDRLVDRNNTVFTDHHQTINMRIEVSGLFIIPRAAAHSIPTSAVAGVRWMGSTGKYHVSQVHKLIELLPRSGSWTTGWFHKGSLVRSWPRKSLNS